MGVMLISPYFSPAVGGVETHLLDLCKYFENRKIKTFVRTYKALGAKNRGKTNENGNYVKIHRMWWPDFNLVFKLERYPILRTFYIGTGIFFDSFIFLINKSKDIDVIQVHGFIAAFFGIILAKIFKKRFVVNTHVGFKFGKGGVINTLIKYVLKNSDKVLVLTNNAKQELVKIGVTEKNIDIYHYWVDKDVFVKVDNARKKLNWGEGFNVLFVGRLVDVKGVGVIVELAKKLKNITFVVAGSGPLSSFLEEESESAKNLKFLGKVDNEKLPVYYSVADVLIVPSKIIDQTYEEGIPRVMIEALHCGLPVITTPSGGIPDVFSNDIGLMVGDKLKDIEIALLKLKNDHKLWKRLSNNCRPFALDLFGIKNAQIIEKSLDR